MMTFELFNKTEKALQPIGLTLDDFYSISCSHFTGGSQINLQGRYSERIVNALKAYNLSYTHFSSWVETMLNIDGVNCCITLTR